MANRESPLDRPRETTEPVTWPPLRDGHNEPGPTDTVGEYRAREQVTLKPVARVPGDVRPYEQPIDVASDSMTMPRRPAELGEAEQAVDDPRHHARGKPSMSSNEGSV